MPVNAAEWSIGMLKDRNQQEIQQKLQAEMVKNNLDALVLSSPEAIFYATGYASSFLYTSWNIGTTLAIVLADGPCEVVMVEFERPTFLRETNHQMKCNTYPNYIFIDDDEADQGEKSAQPDLNTSLRIAAEIIHAKKSNPRVGMELDTLPHSRFEYAFQVFGKENLVNCLEVLRRVRAIKTDWEIDVLRRAAIGAERAMLECAHYIEPGWSEADIWNAFRDACYRQYPDVNNIGFVPSFGNNYAPMFIPNPDVIVKEGDIICLDNGPVIDNYNSDLCRTFVLGKARPEQEEIYRILKKGHDREMELIGPGVKMSDVFHEVMDTIYKAGMTPKYKRGHLGHSVGCNKYIEEYPIISAESNDVFEVGMVLCIETPYYSSKLGGFNLEDEIVITENGYERWTHVNENLYWGR